MRFLRFLFFSLPLIGLLSIVWPAVSLLFWIFSGSPDGQLQLGRIWAKAVTRLSFIKVAYAGLGKFSGLGPCVLVANHPSVLDVPVLYGIPVRGSIFAAKQLFLNPFLFIQLRTGNHLPLGGFGARDTIKSIRFGIRLIAESGRSVLIFPEAPHLDTDLHPFQDGAAFIAIRAGVPIVPMSISGTRQFLGGTVNVRIGEPIDTAGLSVSDRTWLTTCLHERVSQLLRIDETIESSERIA